MVARGKKTTADDARVRPGDADSSGHSTERRTDFLTARQLADVLQVSESTIHRLRRAGRIPAVLLTEKLIRFNLKDVSRALKPRDAARSVGDDAHEQDEEESPQLSFDYPQIKQQD